MLCLDQVKRQKFVKNCYFLTLSLRIDFYKASVTMKFFQSGNDQFRIVGPFTRALDTLKKYSWDDLYSEHLHKYVIGAPKKIPSIMNRSLEKVIMMSGPTVLLIS